MNWHSWWLFVITGLVLDFTPGPAVLYVLSSALREGSRRSVMAALGILSANAFYFALSALGIGAVLLASPNAFIWVKWLGAAYLLYLGVTSLTGHREVLTVSASKASAPLLKLWSGGVILQLSNPKAIVFFTAIVPQFVDPGRPVKMQMAILGITSTVCEFAVLSLYGALAGRAAQWAREPRYALWTNRAAGVLLILAGIGIASIR